MGFSDEDDIIAMQHQEQWVPSTPATDEFDKAVASITQRRGDVYGHPADDFAIATAMMKHLDHVQPVEVRHALRLICVKLARLAHTPNHVDSYIDIAGYARCAVMILDRLATARPSSANPHPRASE